MPQFEASPKIRQIMNSAVADPRIMVEDYLGSFKHLHPQYSPAFLHDMDNVHDPHSKFSAFEAPIAYR